ncbi:PREDICTED: coiled-coil domain-containing protein 108 isoform X3 [Chinchilla lanigera]|uniref:coiled-coil domain-containing protein 108 isoform X3 n=1 Tax=Chinchilla lanigera TaxID=34839 RepID=UPI0006988FAC|nr:PREDICTED: coiled-coil domain-containing protein 108 isoform X3 [Chinchilla lanigera]
MRPADSGDYTGNSGGSRLSASTMAVPTINGSNMGMSACSSTFSAQPASPTGTPVCSPKKQDRVKKRVVWGIEVAEELQWKGWELGKETSRNLVLKNRTLKIQKIKYRPPKTKFFFTVIPQPIFLSPGITFTLPIVFRPLEEKEYMDQVWFEKEEGMFSVDLRATLPYHKLVCPPCLQLPMCAIGDIVEAWFCLDNVGDLPTFFSWEFPSPFQILPTTGLLEPGLTCRVRVTFQPLVAVIHEVQATCWYGEGSRQKSSIRLQAVAGAGLRYPLPTHTPQKTPRTAPKYPDPRTIAVPQSVFGRRNKCFPLGGPRQVNAPFKIEMTPDMLARDQAFSCSTGHGIVPPGEKKYVSMFFHPNALDGRAMGYFSIIPSGSGSQTLLQVVGFSTGPAVSLQHYCINFNWVSLGESSEKTLWIENQSDCAAHFQFAIDCKESVFSIRPHFGTLVGKARMTLHCTFQPTHPIICFRRVACLIHHQDPLFLDLIGTCHSDSIKPVILTPQHLTWYRTHLARGLTLYPPDILTAMLKERTLQRDSNGTLMLPSEDLDETKAPQHPDIPPMMEYFFDGTRDMAIFPPPISVEPAEVDFGGCPGPEAPTPAPLCLRNYTKGKITVVWTRRSGCPFWVTPDTFDVPPLKSMAMRLHFQPPSPNCLYFVELEAFAVYKVLQSYNNIEEDCTVCPSWCLIVRARGHSYGATLEHHVPQYFLDAPEEVSMQSREEPLQLKLDTSKCVFFKPTWVGCSSTSSFTFHNPSRLPLEFEWRVSQQNRQTLAVQPSKGLIQPNESLTLTWIFSPLEETKYLFRVGMWVWEAGLPPDVKPPATVHYMIRLVGLGITSSLSAETKQLDFGNMLVGSTQSRSLVLLNDGNCTLYYHLYLEQRSPEGPDGDPSDLQLDCSEGSMPPHSRVTISLTACPKHRSQYSWTISYSLLSHKDNKVGEKQELCGVSLVAVYPLLSILDACPLGGAKGITRKHLWRLFSLDTLNSYLVCDPTPCELTYKVPTRHSVSQIPPVFTPLKLDFNFGAAPVKTPPSVVLLAMKNSGVVPLDWAFLFPSDQKIDLELWAEQIEFDCAELHQMRIEDNRIFSISPKAGSLSPGQEQIVEFKYSHLFIGTDRLPVLFKVSHGREILLNFIGVTVKLEQKYVHFTSTTHQFIPVPIGDTLPPRQIYELYNGGSVPVTYEVQTGILSHIQEKNFDHPIFCCLNPKGEIQPGTTARVLWVFSPIEAKTYTVDVPIHIVGWNSALIHFQGVGYDPHVMGDTAPFHNISSWDNSSICSRLMIPEQNVYLSQSHISLGNIPVQSKCSRLLFLNNISKNETVIFDWQPRPLDFGEVSVSPMIGEVAPEETVPFVVTLKASVHASFYSVDLVCKVYRQELMRQYHKELQEWKDEKVRQEEEFTITDRKVERRAYCTACDPVRRYKTLPPIMNQQSLGRPASWNLRLTKEETSWPCPQPPVPDMLSLGLTARAHATDDFLDNFFLEFPCHFLHRDLPKRKTPREESETSGEDSPNTEGGPVSKQKKQLLVDCLTTIIRGLLEDKTFHEAVDQSLVEQVPYFCQFLNKQSARFMTQNSQYLLPTLPLPSSSLEDRKGEEQKDKQRLGKQERGKEEKGEKEEGKLEGLNEEEESEEEEDLSAEEEEKEEGKDVKITGSGTEPALQPQPSSQQSQQWQWQQDLKVTEEEEQHQDEKEGISRLPAFANLREALLENMIRNILVEASRGEVVLTSRPRIIALPPLSTPRTLTPLLLPRIQQAAVPDPLAPRSTYSLLMPAHSPTDLPP